MRIWLRPDRLAQLKLTPADVIARASTSRTRSSPPARSARRRPAAGRSWSTPSPPRAACRSRRSSRTSSCAPTPTARALRLKDVARVELAAQGLRASSAASTASPATLIGIFLQPGANALDVAEDVNDARLKRARRALPGRASPTPIPYDTTRFVEVSIREVVKTLVEAMAAGVPGGVPVPAELARHADPVRRGAGVADRHLRRPAAARLLDQHADAVRHGARHRHRGGRRHRGAGERRAHHARGGPRAARGRDQGDAARSTSPIIAIVLVLCAVFVPIAFLGGLTGELYRQFAVTISIAVVISGIVALTLTPALCVLILKREHRQPGRFFALVQPLVRARHRPLRDRRRLDDPPRRHRRCVLFAVHGGGHRRPVAHHARQPGARRGPGLLHRRGDPARRRHAGAHRQGGERGARGDQVQPGQRATRWPSPASTSSAAASATTRPPSSSRRSTGTSARSPARALVGEFFMKTGHIKEGLVLAFDPPPIFGLGTAGGFEFYIQNRGEGGPKRWPRCSASSWRGQQGPEARHACRRCGAPTCRSSTSTSTARRPRRSACRSTRSSTRSPPRSAPTTSTTSTSTAAPGRC